MSVFDLLSLTLVPFLFVVAAALQQVSEGVGAWGAVVWVLLPVFQHLYVLCGEKMRKKTQLRWWGDKGFVVYMGRGAAGEVHVMFCAAREVWDMGRGGVL